MDKSIVKKLESLSRDELYDILTKAGISFPEAGKEELKKEELLLVSDEADLNIIKSELGLK